MKQLLENVKADLLDRRMLPLVLVAAAALIGAVAWTVVSSGSSASTTAAAPPPSLGTPSAGGLSAVVVTPNKAVAETTVGGGEQRRGSARDPFAPLPGSGGTGTAHAASASPAKGSSSSSSSPASSQLGGGSGSGSQASTPAPAPAPSKQTVYAVTALFGVVPPGTAPADAQLTPFADMKLLTPLPDAVQPLIVYRGVTSGGRSATFTIVGEVILHGAAGCLPNASQCEAIDLAPGKAEQLEFLPSSGPSITYELRVVSISPSLASAASVRRYLAGTSRAGSRLLAQAGRVTLPYLRPSAQPGVLFFPSSGAHAARSHAARRHPGH